MTRKLQLKVSIPTELYADGDVWKDCASDYPAKGHPGIAYRKDVDDRLGPDAVSEALLYYDADGSLAGILIYFPNDIPVRELWMKCFAERAGNFNVLVDPDHQRLGIGMELLREAVKRWSIDFGRQNYTLEGAKLIQRFLSKPKAHSKKAGAR